jgi:hypothetical protein
LVSSRYRHCRNPPRFSLALQLHRVAALAHTHKPHRELMLACFFANEELTLAALRENFVWQAGRDP